MGKKRKKQNRKNVSMGTVTIWSFGCDKFNPILIDTVINKLDWFRPLVEQIDLNS
jgi:hypothetical protein